MVHATMVKVDPGIYLLRLHHTELQQELQVWIHAPNPTESIAVTIYRVEIPTQKALPRPPHLVPILKLLRGRGQRSKSTADDRSRSPPQRDLNSFSSNATSRRLHFYQGSAASLPGIENLSAIKDSLQVLPLHQVRTHIQSILAQQQPFDTDPQKISTPSSPVPLSSRLTTAVHNIRDPIQDN